MAQQVERTDPRPQSALDCSGAAAALLDRAPFGAWIVDESGTLRYMNAAGAALLDVAPDDLTGATQRLQMLTDLDGNPLPPEELPIARALHGEARDNLRYRVRRETGPDRFLGFSLTPLAMGALICASDRTADRDLERARDDFLASVAHDLRSPLTSIRGSAQLALRWVRRNITQDAELLNKCLANIDQAADRLNRMLQTLMDSARIQQGRLVLQRGPTDLVALVKEVVDHYRLESSKHRFVIDAPKTPIIGQWDAALLERAVENLIGNAVKYSPGGGEIAVVCRVESGEARLVVRDQGVGIPAEALPYIFERFYRANRATLGEIEGNGLGLFAVRGIVTAHGGTITARSEEGKGTEMTVRLPLAPVENAA